MLWSKVWRFSYIHLIMTREPELFVFVPSDNVAGISSAFLRGERRGHSHDHCDYFIHWCVTFKDTCRLGIRINTGASGRYRINCKVLARVISRIEVCVHAEREAIITEIRALRSLGLTWHKSRESNIFQTRGILLASALTSGIINMPSLSFLAFCYDCACNRLYNITSSFPCHSLNFFLVELNIYKGCRQFKLLHIVFKAYRLKLVYAGAEKKLKNNFYFPWKPDINTYGTWTVTLQSKDIIRYVDTSILCK